MLAERVGFWIDVEVVQCEPDGFRPWFRIRTGHTSLFELAIEQTLETCYRSKEWAMSAGLAAAEKIIEKRLADYVQKFSTDQGIWNAPGTEIG